MRTAVRAFLKRYNSQWLIERHGHKTPREAYAIAMQAVAASPMKPRKCPRNRDRFRALSVWTCAVGARRGMPLTEEQQAEKPRLRPDHV